MSGLPKKYAKMGFIRGWKEFRKKGRKKKAKVFSMKRKGKKHYGKSKGFTMQQAFKVLAGAAIAAVYEVFVSPMIPLADNVKNILELVVGLFLASSGKMPMPVRAFGAALATINAYSLIVPFVSNWKGGASANGANW
jgi:hypothetical protein